MKKYFLLLLILFPAVEISLFLISSNIIGILPTMLFIVLTSALGAYFARKQGIEAFQKVQRDLQYGKMPGHHCRWLLHSDRWFAAAHAWIPF